MVNPLNDKFHMGATAGHTIPPKDLVNLTQFSYSGLPERKH